jgi:hypothetical protein
MGGGRGVQRVVTLLPTVQVFILHKMKKECKSLWGNNWPMEFQWNSREHRIDEYLEGNIRKKEKNFKLLYFYIPHSILNSYVTILNILMFPVNWSPLHSTQLEKLWKIQPGSPKSCERFPPWMEKIPTFRGFFDSPTELRTTQLERPNLVRQNFDDCTSKRTQLLMTELRKLHVFFSFIINEK